MVCVFLVCRGGMAILQAILDVWLGGWLEGLPMCDGSVGCSCGLALLKEAGLSGCGSCTVSTRAQGTPTHWHL